MTDEYHNGPDGRDPLAAVFDDYQPPPPDVIPRNRVDGIAELDIDRLVGTTTEVSHYEMTEGGITKTVERAGICAPIVHHPERNEK